MPPRKGIRRYKIVTVGDGCCGKTSLQVRYVHDEFPDDHSPTVFDTYTTELVLDDEPIELTLWDTAGQEDYERLRPLSYSSTHAVIICFSVESHSSLKNVKEKWYPEVRHFCPNAPIILVANKIDLRRDRATVESMMSQNKRPITSHEGAIVSKKIRAHSYRECSSLNRDGVNEVFETAARAALEVRKSLNPVCRLL